MSTNKIFSSRSSVFGHGPLLRSLRPTRLVAVRFKKDDAPEQKEEGKPAASEKKSAGDRQVDAALRQMKASDPAIARMVLKAWKEAGVTDAKGVRRALIRAGVSTVGVLALQSAFEAVAAYCSFATARTVGVQEFPLHEAVAVLITFLGMYFLVGIAFDLFTIGATITSTALLGTKADVVFSTVEALAGEKSGLGIVDKAQQAVNTGKVILALNSIATALKMKNEEGGAPSLQTLDRLGALMALKDAEERTGFSPAKYGISDDEALRIANQFSTFDANSDNRLEFSEFKKFCDASEFELNEAEAKVALSMLDANGDGYIEFDEFARWWVKSNEDRMADVADAKGDVAEAKPEKQAAPKE